MDKHLNIFFQKPQVLKVLKRNKIVKIVINLLIKIDRYGNVIDRKIVRIT
jgi:hypothetical protein